MRSISLLQNSMPGYKPVLVATLIQRDTVASYLMHYSHLDTHGLVNHLYWFYFYILLNAFFSVSEDSQQKLCMGCIAGIKHKFKKRELVENIPI